MTAPFKRSSVEGVLGDHAKRLGILEAVDIGGVDVVIHVKVYDESTVISTGDGQRIFMISDDMDGMVLKKAAALVTTVSSSGVPTIQIRNVTDSVDMLSTKVTIDASEFTSYTAAATSVVDTANDDVATGDRISVDVDVSGTGAKGLEVILTFGFVV